MTLNLALLILFVAIQIADVWTTHRGFEMGAEEAMPLGRGLFKKLGFWPTILIIKGGAIAIAVALTVYVSNAWIFTGVMNLIGTYVLWSNIRVLRGA